MASWFDGFFARPSVERPAVLPAGAVWREIRVPLFVGVGVRIASQGARPKRDETRRLLAEVGLGGATHWLYLSYVTWAGQIDGVYGMGASDGLEFGAVNERDENKVEAASTELMGAFGVEWADALNFPPFARGFWGE